MKKLLLSLILLAATFAASAKDFSWYCAVEWTEEKPEWVFVYEDIKQENDGNYRIFVKWEFPNEDKRKKAKQVWIITPNFDKFKVISSVGYNSSGDVVFTEDTPYADWKYVLPDTYAESVVETTKDILLKQ